MTADEMNELLQLRASLTAVSAELKCAEREHEDCRDELSDREIKLAEVSRRLAQVTTALEKYGTHTQGCDIHLCANCGHKVWLHDWAEDTDGVTCLQLRQFFMPRHCNCGFTEVLAKQSERP